MNEISIAIDDPRVTHWDGRGNAVMIYGDGTMHVQDGKTFLRLPIQEWLKRAHAFDVQREGDAK